MRQRIPITQTLYGPRLKEVLEHGYDIGLADYPIYDEKQRDNLNQRIVDHFYLREIGSETVEQFIMYLNRTMREQMPILNPVFKAVNTDDDLLENTDTTTEYDQNTTAQGTGTTTTAGDHSEKTDDSSVNSNAPQVNMAAADPMQYYNNGTFGHHAGTSQDGSTSTNDNTDKSTTGYTGRTHGLSGVLKGDALSNWIDANVNPLTELFEALEPCFSQLYTSHYDGF